MPKVKKKILGGPEKRSFNKDNVYPTNFTSDDPFWDTAAICSNLEQEIREGSIHDFILIQHKEGQLTLNWRGSNPMTTGLGMLAWAEKELLRE